MKLRFAFALALPVVLAACDDTNTTPALQMDAGDLDSGRLDAARPDAQLDAAQLDAAEADAAQVDAATATYRVGGTVSGLTGTGLALRNGVDTLPISEDGTFMFETAVEEGVTYSVTVDAQPMTPAQTCVVTNGSGTVATNNITDIGVECTNDPACTDITTIPGDVYTRNIDMIGTNLFFLLGEEYGTFKSYDVADPARAEELGSLTLTHDTGCWYAWGVKVGPGGDFAYLYGNGCNTLPVIDITDPTNPVPVVEVAGPMGGGTMDATVCDNTLYVVAQEKGVAAYDVTNPANPVFSGQSADMPSSAYPYAVTCARIDDTNDAVFVGDYGRVTTGGLRVYSYNKTTDTFATRGTYLADGRRGSQGWPLSATSLYMSTNAGLDLFDTTDLDTITTPISLEGFDSDSNAKLVAYGTHLYAQSAGGDLGIFDISTPTAPTLLFRKPEATSTLSTLRYATTTHTYLAYTQDGLPTISICELTDL